MIVPMNRQIRLAARPAGSIKDSDWEHRSEEVGSPGSGEFLGRTRFISLDPAMRGWINEGKSYVPPVALGEVMRSFSAGTVDASNHPDFKVGDAVQGMFGVQSYAISKGERVGKLNLSQGCFR